MKKWQTFRFVVMVLAATLLIIGPAASLAETPKPIELVHSTTYPETNPFSQLLKAYLTDIETLSQGKVKVIYHWAGALGAAKDHYDMVVNKICDIVNVPVGWTPGRFPLSEIPALPIAGNSSYQRSLAIDEVRKKGNLAKEHSDVQLLFCATSAPQKLWSKKNISSLADLKGLKIRANTKPEIEVVKALGAVPTPMPVTEVYLALDRGVIDASFADYLMSNQFKIFEIAPQVIELNVFAAPVVTVLNKKWWDNAPEDVKSAVLKASEENLTKITKAIDAVETKLKDACIKRGAKVLELSEADRASLKTLFQPIIDEWVTQTEAKGYPAKAALQTYMDTLEKNK